MSLVKMSLSFIPRMAAVQPFQNHAMLMLLEGRVQEALASYREFDMLGLAMTAQSRLVREFVELSIVDEEEREKHLLALLETADSHEYNLIAQLLMLESPLSTSSADNAHVRCEKSTYASAVHRKTTSSLYLAGKPARCALC